MVLHHDLGFKSGKITAETGMDVVHRGTKRERSDLNLHTDVQCCQIGRFPPDCVRMHHIYLKLLQDSTGTETFFTYTVLNQSYHEPTSSIFDFVEIDWKSDLSDVRFSLRKMGHSFCSNDS